MKILTEILRILALESNNFQGKFQKKKIQALFVFKKSFGRNDFKALR